jgi:dTDP-4-amino-4,6-dideoxygalactose transaminase
MWRDQNPLFEKEFASYIGAKFALGTSYGRTALYLGLKAINVQEKEVIIPAFICTVVRHAVVAAGGIPRFVDVDLENLTYDVSDLRNKISERTKAIVLVHYFGRVARNMEQVIQVARERKIALVEDCAHSLGADYKGKKIGTFGDFGIFSLTKNTVNFGGGVLVTNDAHLYQNAKKILKNEKMPLKKRLVDFPMVVSYGIEQIADKVLLETVRSDNFKLVLINLPSSLLKIRKVMLGMGKKMFSLLGPKPRQAKCSKVSPGVRASIAYEQSIHMEPIIASVGRSQLKKVETLNQRRKKIVIQLSELNNCHFRNSDGFIGRDVYTHAVLRFPGNNISEVIEKSRNAGLLLKATWPTHQKLWEGQATKNVKTIEKEFLTWNINPDLTEEKIRRFIKVVSECVDDGNSKLGTRNSKL